MSSQIFKEKFSPNILYSFLDQICKKDEKKYIFNKESYKLLSQNSFLCDTFIEEIRPYYFTAKFHYIEKKISFNKISTIIRQICNYLKMDYSSQIKYSKSKYEIIYYIYT